MKTIIHAKSLMLLSLHTMVQASPAHDLARHQAEQTAVHHYASLQASLTTYRASLNDLENRLRQLAEAAGRPSGLDQSAWKKTWLESDAVLNALTEQSATLHGLALSWQGQPQADAHTSQFSTASSRLYEELRSRTDRLIRDHSQIRESIMTFGTSPEARFRAASISPEARNLAGTLLMESLLSLVEKQANQLSRHYLNYEAGHLSLAVSTQRALCNQVEGRLNKAGLPSALKAGFSSRLQTLCEANLQKYGTDLESGSFVVAARRRFIRSFFTSRNTACSPTDASTHCQNLNFYKNLDPTLAADPDLETSHCIELALDLHQKAPHLLEEQDQDILSRSLDAKAKLVQMCQSRKPLAAKPDAWDAGEVLKSGTTRLITAASSSPQCATVKQEFAEYVQLYESSGRILNELIAILDDFLANRIDEATYERTYDRKSLELQNVLERMDQAYPETRFQRDHSYRAEWSPHEIGSPSGTFVPWLINFGPYGWERTWTATLGSQNWYQQGPTRNADGSLWLSFKASIHDYCIDQWDVRVFGLWGDAGCPDGRCLLLKPASYLKAGVDNG